MFGGSGVVSSFRTAGSVVRPARSLAGFFAQFESAARLARQMLAGAVLDEQSRRETKLTHSIAGDPPALGPQPFAELRSWGD